MPGTPDPVLGSDALTLLVAVVAAVAVTAVPFVRDVPADLRLLSLGGLGYATAFLAVWAGARYLTGTFTSSFLEHPLNLAAFLALAGLVLAAQFVVPYYLHARWDMVAPLAGLFVATTVVAYAFLRVNGETDPIGLYALFFGPALIAVTGVLAVLEEGVRRAIAAV